MKEHFNMLAPLRIILIISLILMVLFFTGFSISCQSQEQAPAEQDQEPVEETVAEGSPATPSTTKVIIEGFAFKPAEITVPVGSTVTWNNRDSVIHTVTARDKTFDSGGLPGGGTFSYTFETKGTFEYHCTPHPFMTGKVTVE